MGAGFIARLHRDLLAGTDVGHRVTAVFDPDADRAARFAADCDAVVADSPSEAIEAAPGLTGEDRRKIFEGNARRIYPRLKVIP